MFVYQQGQEDRTLKTFSGNWGAAAGAGGGGRPLTLSDLQDSRFYNLWLEGKTPSIKTTAWGLLAQHFPREDDTKAR